METQIEVHPTYLGMDEERGRTFCRTISTRQPNGLLAAVPDCTGCDYAKDGQRTFKKNGTTVKKKWQACPDRRTP